MYSRRIYVWLLVDNLFKEEKKCEIVKRKKKKKIIEI